MSVTHNKLTSRYHSRRNDKTYLCQQVALQNYYRDALGEESTGTGQNGREKQEALLPQRCGKVSFLAAAPESVRR